LRFILSASRFLLGLIVSLHILNLRGSVKLADRQYNKAIRDTDTAVLAARIAQEAKTVAGEAERRTAKATRALSLAAQAEASSLRRGVSIL
jgi:hypothetical protein